MERPKVIRATGTPRCSTGHAGACASQYLKDQGYFHYPTLTGYFGSYTWRALAAFQWEWDNKLEPVGYVGPKSELALNKLLDQSLASLASSTSAAPAAPTATSTISLVPTPPPATSTSAASASSSPQTAPSLVSLPPAAPIYTTPPPTPAIGQPWHAPSGGGGGGGPPAPAPVPTPPPAPAPYVAQAVHFDGTKTLQRFYSNTGTLPGDPLFPNSQTGLISVWVKTGSSNLVQTGNNWINLLTTMPVGQVPANWSSLGIAALGFEMYPGNFTQYAVDNFRTLSADTWYHVAMSWDTNHPNGEKRGSFILNGVVVADFSNSSFVHGGDDGKDNDFVQWSYYDGAQKAVQAIPDIMGDPYVQDAVDSMRMDMSDFQMWTGIPYVDLTDPANIAKFIDSNGKPVDPSIATSAFGQQKFLFRGDANSFGNNQGTGGSFDTVKNFATHGRNGAGAITLTGAVAGQSVIDIIDMTNGNVGGYPSTNFETTISVNDQLQQIDSADLSATSLIVQLSGSLTNASTSPSN